MQLKIPRTDHPRRKIIPHPRVPSAESLRPAPPRRRAQCSHPRSLAPLPDFKTVTVHHFSECTHCEKLYMPAFIRIRPVFNTSLLSINRSVAGLAGFTAAYLGGQTADIIGEGNFVSMWNFQFDDMQFPLLLGSIMRFLTGFLILRVKQPLRKKKLISGSQAFGTVWRMLIGKTYRSGT